MLAKSSMRRYIQTLQEHILVKIVYLTAITVLIFYLPV